MRLEILLTIFAGSQFLADTLVRNPGFLEWITLPENLHQGKSKEDLEGEFRAGAETGQSQVTWLNQLRRFRRREILRIGTRDMYLKVPTEQVVLELSSLADALTSAALANVWTRSAEAERKVPGDLGELAEHFCILAFGKLGGAELNYSSDIDLMGIFDVSPAFAGALGLDPTMLKYLFTWVMERVTLDLSDPTADQVNWFRPSPGLWITTKRPHLYGRFKPPSSFGPSPGTSVSVTPFSTVSALSSSGRGGGRTSSSPSKKCEKRPSSKEAAPQRQGWT
jgi:glutamine synthetase adenylyltransferase